MNIAKHNFIDKMMAVNKSINFFLSGDYMFIIKMLDGSKILSPTSETGWNFYHLAAKDQQGEVAPSGLQTDMEVHLDRKHPESIVPSIPLRHIVFDTMHGLARIVEKLLSLEVEQIMYEGNKNQQVQGNAPSTKQLLDNLVSNINKRGVRQGNV